MPDPQSPTTSTSPEIGSGTGSVVVDDVAGGGVLVVGSGVDEVVVVSTTVLEDESETSGDGLHAASRQAARRYDVRRRDRRAMGRG
ncbi:MAG TPA: hypothetical protein VFS66_10350 [Acidimicrobiia bacterium]|nr:hypothetical protein [Acidimicrobiia bacterium]